MSDREGRREPGSGRRERERGTDPVERKRRQLMERVRERERRRMRAREEGDRGLWFGLGMFGLVGWSVTIPTLIGLAVGLWIDATRETGYSFTLMFLIGGVALGALNAWYWVRRSMEDKND